VLKVSGVTALIGYAFLVITHAQGPNESIFQIWWTAIWAIFPLTAGLVLQKTLKNAKWGVLLGVSLTLLLMVFILFVDDVFLHIT